MQAAFFISIDLKNEIAVSNPQKRKSFFKNFRKFCPHFPFSTVVYSEGWQKATKKGGDFDDLIIRD